MEAETLDFVDAVPLPEPQEGGAMVSTGDWLIAVGGWDTVEVTDRVWLRRADDDAWIEGPPLPEPRQHIAMGIVGDRVVVAGGDVGDPHDDAWSAPITDDGLGAWRDEAPLPRPLAFAGSAAFGDALWLFGGFTTGAEPQDGIVRGAMAEDGTISWSDEGTLVEARFAPSAVATSEGVLVVGGADRTFRGVEETWWLAGDGDRLEAPETGPPLPRGAMAPVLVAFEDTIWVAGGFTGQDSLRRAHVLDGEDWVRAGRLPASRFSAYHTVHNDVLHVLGGWTGNFGSVLDDAGAAPLCVPPDVEAR